MSQRNVLPDIAMIEHPERWPAWPVLPLKRRLADGTNEVGVLVDTPNGQTTVLRINMYELCAETYKSADRREYIDAGEIVVDGWRVD